MDEYHLVVLPVNSAPEDLTDPEARILFDWFVSNQFERIQELANFVNSTSDQNFDPNFEPESLKPLGAWLQENIEYRSRTADEIARSKASLPEWLHNHVSEKAPTARTLSLIFDVGLYFAQVFIKNQPGIEWVLHKGGRTNINRNRPVLTGFAMPLNPLHIAKVAVLSIAEDRKNVNRLYELYEIWRGYLK